MSAYALELHERWKKRLARMHAAALRTQPRAESVVPVEQEETPEPVSAEISQFDVEAAIRRALAVATDMRVTWRVTWDTKPPLTVRDIIVATAAAYNVSVTEMLAHRRTKHIVLPRHVAMYLAKTLTHRSLPDIGRQFAGRDHTTVLHAVRKIENLVGNDAALAEKVSAISAYLESTHAPARVPVGYIAPKAKRGTA